MKLPRVLIITPVYDGKSYIMKEFIENANKINYPNKHHIFIDNSSTKEFSRKLAKNFGVEVHHVERGANSREAITRAYEFGRLYAIENNYDYIFQLECDIMCPKDIIQGLMTWGKDCVTGLYTLYNKENVHVPCIAIAYFDETLLAWGSRLLELEEWDDYADKGLKQVHTGGFGALLMHKRIFKRFGHYYDPRYTKHNDVYFFNKLFEAKIPVYVDTGAYCIHENSSWDDVKDR
jgi:GT2 family glycosyltransferase